MVHQCFDFETAKKELTALLKGDKPLIPASGIGSNVGRPEQERRTPRGVICGGLVPREEFEALHDYVRGEVSQDVAWFKLYPEDVEKYLPAGAPLPSPASGPPPVEIIAKVWREKLAGLQ